jgi:hypothetical protein
MACAACAKRKAAAKKQAAEYQQLLAANDRARSLAKSNPVWLVKVIDFDGLWDDKYPLGAGAFYALSNADVLRLLDAGHRPTFVREEVAENFMVYNKLEVT